MNNTNYIVYRQEDEPKNKNGVWIHHKVYKDLSSPIVVQIYSKGKWQDIGGGEPGGNTIEGVGVKSIQSISKDEYDALEVKDPETIYIVNNNDVTYDIYLGADEVINSNITDILWSDLVTLRDDSMLIPGMYYRIVDYTTTTSQVNTTSAGHNFDIIVLATDINKLNENAKACLHDGDTYFSGANVNLDTWELKYCLDNDTTRFAWADTNSTGRGVIYYMKDEWNNECPYDFKNIQFKTKLNSIGEYSTNGTDTYVYTFHFRQIEIGAGDYDCSLQPAYRTGTINTLCRNNIIKEYFLDGKQKLNANLFLGNGYYYIEEEDHYWEYCAMCANNRLNVNCRNNIFNPHSNDNILEYNCYNNIFYSNSDEGGANYIIMGHSCAYNIFRFNCRNNTIGSACTSNTFEDSCVGNTLGNGCRNNTIGSGCFYNIFGDSCIGSTLGLECTNNTFGDEFNNNTIGDYFVNNTFGNGCSGNTFGDDCYNNTFGNGCGGNTFGDDCYNNAFGNGCYGNTFGDDCYNNTFGNECSRNTFETPNGIKFCTVTSGVNSEEIPFVEDEDAAQIACYKQNGTFVVKFIADAFNS